MGNVNDRVTANTTEILQGAGAINFGGVDIGSFRDGVTVTVNVDYNYTRSDYTIGEIDAEATLGTCEVNTIMEQGSIRNMAIAMGGNTSSSSSSSSSIVFDFGPELAQNPQELILEGMSGGAGSPSVANKAFFRRYTFFRANRIGSTAFTLRRGIETMFPVTWKCLLNTNSKFYRTAEADGADPLP